MGRARIFGAVRSMKQFLVTLAGVFAGLLLFFVGVPIVIIMVAMGASGPAPVPGKTVLSLDLRGGLTDQTAADPLATFTGPGMSVSSVVLALRRAENDGKVKSLIVRLPEGGMEPAAADEIAAAFRRFKAKGKPIYAHSQGLYSSGVITSTYGLAAAANEIWMHSSACSIGRGSPPNSNSGPITRTRSIPTSTPTTHGPIRKRSSAG
jgi:protease IV